MKLETRHRPEWRTISVLVAIAVLTHLTSCSNQPVASPHDAARAARVSLADSYRGYLSDGVEGPTELDALISITTGPRTRDKSFSIAASVVDGDYLNILDGPTIELTGGTVVWDSVTSVVKAFLTASDLPQRWVLRWGDDTITIPFIYSDSVQTGSPTDRVFVYQDVDPLVPLDIPLPGVPHDVIYVDFIVAYKVAGQYPMQWHETDTGTISLPADFLTLISPTAPQFNVYRTYRWLYEANGRSVGVIQTEPYTYYLNFRQ